MTHHLRRTLEIIARTFPKQTKVLEIGSRQQKNQRRLANLRALFPKTEYVGIDLLKGPGVDKVADAESIPFQSNTFSMILCLETLEHTIRPWLIADEMARVMKDDGVVIVSSQQNYPLHKHPNDYFRFTPIGLASFFISFKEKLIFSISPPFDNEVRLNPQLVVVVAWKKANKSIKRKLKEAMRDNIHLISGHKPYRHRFFDGLNYIRRGVQEINYQLDIEFF